MGDPLKLYKDFIDGLLTRLSSGEAVRMDSRILHDIPPLEVQERDRRRGYAEAVAAYERFTKYNELLMRLTDSDRAMIAELLQGEKEAGMAEMLAFLADGRYQLIWNGTELPFEPFDTPYHYDFAAHIAGDPWPDERAE